MALHGVETLPRTVWAQSQVRSVIDVNYGLVIKAGAVFDSSMASGLPNYRVATRCMLRNLGSCGGTVVIETSARR